MLKNCIGQLTHVWYIYLYLSQVCGTKPIYVIRWFTGWEGGGDVIPKFLVFITLYSDVYIQNYISTVENVTWMNYQNFKYRYMKTAL